MINEVSDMGLFTFILAGLAIFVGLFAITVLLMIWTGRGKIRKKKTA